MMKNAKIEEKKIVPPFIAHLGAPVRWRWHCFNFYHGLHFHFIITFIFVKFCGQAREFASVEDKSPVNSWILQGTKENKISNICPMQHIDHHNTGMDLILQFYEGSSCQSMPPSPPQPEELCGSWRLWQGDYQHRERAHLPCVALQQEPCNALVDQQPPGGMGWVPPPGILHHYLHQLVTGGLPAQQVRFPW